MYCCKTENQEYILFSASEVELDQGLSEIPIVKEYLDAFLEDILELSPERETKFFTTLG